VKVRFLGHSCIEIKGKFHLVIDPDFTREPDEDVEYILISHAHRDHIARVAEIPTGKVIAAANVCEIAHQYGVPKDRLVPVSVGDRIGNISVYKGFSKVNDPIYALIYFLFRRRFPDPGGTPLSYLIEDEASLLHLGDAHEADLDLSPDILCLPWREAPFGAKKYKKKIFKMANQFSAKYVIPVHHDLAGTEADAAELQEGLQANLLDGAGWHTFGGSGNYEPT